MFKYNILGNQFPVRHHWLWSVGAACNTSPGDDADKRKRMPDLPLDRQIRIGTGIGLFVVSSWQSLR